MNIKVPAICIASLFLFTANAQADPGESAPEKKIEWCRLQHPGTVTMKAKTKSEYIYGQVFIPGCSEGEKVCKGVRAEACIGPKGQEPTSCFPAIVNPEFRTDTNNDEYMAQVYSPKPGEYSLIFQFTVNDGRSWVKCDFDDEHGYDISKAGVVIVTE